LRESVEGGEPEGESILRAPGRCEERRGAEEGGSIEEKNETNRHSNRMQNRERPQRRGRGQTKRTWLTQLVAIICDQEGG
jgi:hypothetical protein